MDDGQLEELLERIEVSIAVEQRVMFGQTEGGDQAVDGLSHRMTTTPKGAIVTRRVVGKRNAAGFEDDQLRELAVSRGQVCRTRQDVAPHATPAQPEAGGVGASALSAQTTLSRAANLTDSEKGNFVRHHAPTRRDLWVVRGFRGG
jgi:hypothetical protein